MNASNLVVENEEKSRNQARRGTTTHKSQEGRQSYTQPPKYFTMVRPPPVATAATAPSEHNVRFVASAPPCQMQQLIARPELSAWRVRRLLCSAGFAQIQNSPRPVPVSHAFPRPVRCLLSSEFQAAMDDASPKIEGGRDECKIIAEIGINHNGSIEPKKLIMAAKVAGA